MDYIAKDFSRQFNITDPDDFEIDLIQWTDKEGLHAISRHIYLPVTLSLSYQIKYNTSPTHPTDKQVFTHYIVRSVD